MIFKASYTHARNLATFVGLYKSCMYLLQRLNQGKQGYYDSFWAGLFGGYAVFGRGKQSSVNQQICIYVFARVVLGLAKLSVAKNVVPSFDGRTQTAAWPIFASFSWALVMLLFKHHPETLQPSLRSSMQYL
jgi:peroxisomal membrane protein 4